jgi:hypothetical protein
MDQRILSSAGDGGLDQAVQFLLLAESYVVASDGQDQVSWGYSLHALGV